MTTLKVLFLSYIVAAANAQPGCSICGDGNQVGNPSEFIDIPGAGTFLCSEVEFYADSGQLSPCAIVQQLPGLEICGCQPSTPTTAAPTTLPTSASPTTIGCSICGDGKEVGAPDAIFEFPGFDPYTCGVLEEGGANGTIPIAQCKFLKTISQLDVCECQPVGAETSSPLAIPAVETTETPVVPPTEAPVDPTESPVVPPTEAPVDPTESPAVPPTEAPVDPTEAPVNPTQAPVDPTEAPVDPTEAPVHPTQAPVIPATNAPVGSKSGKKGKSKEKNTKKQKNQKQKPKKPSH